MRTVRQVVFPSRTLTVARRTARGFVLPFVMLVMVVTLVTGLAFMQIAGMEATSATLYSEDMRALAAAELGVQRASAMASSQVAPWPEMTLRGSPLIFRRSADPLFAGHEDEARRPYGLGIGADGSGALVGLDGFDHG